MSIFFWYNYYRFLVQMIEPQYQEMLKSEIPHVSKDGIHVAVIAGEALGASVRSPC